MNRTSESTFGERACGSYGYKATICITGPSGGNGGRFIFGLDPRSCAEMKHVPKYKREWYTL